jgi:hypothetical protein
MTMVLSILAASIAIGFLACTFAVFALSGRISREEEAEAGEEFPAIRLVSSR